MSAKRLIAWSFLFAAALCVAGWSNAAAGQEHEPKAADEHATDAAHGDEAHAAGGHGAHDHIGLGNPGEMVEKPQDVKSDLAFATFLVFLVLLAILWKFAWGPIVEALERREQTIANHIAEAERNHEAAKALLKEYEGKLAQAANEVREMMEEARRDAEHAKQEILAEGKTLAEAERARALHDIEAATDQALEALTRRSADLAVELAGKILQSKITAAEHERIIQEAMAKFPATSTSSN